MHPTLTFKKLTTVEQMLPNWQLITQLTASLTQENYKQYLTQMVPHNYYQVVAYDGETCVGISGYWIATKLYSGKYLEIDNFVVDGNYRNAGIGKQMVDWLENEARANDCKIMMLDAYVENFKAHRFYYREGFIARGYHYLKFL
jgi:GNAT superfamily N-acetyltransferase